MTVSRASARGVAVAADETGERVDLHLLGGGGLDGVVLDLDAVEGDARRQLVDVEGEGGVLLGHCTGLASLE